MIHFEDIHFGLAGKTILKGISGKLEPGKMHAVLGPNGAGKSTLLKVLSGLLKPGQGKICWEEKELADWDPSELARKRAVLPQKSPAGIPFPVREVIWIGRYPHAQLESKAQSEQVVHRMAERTAVDHLLDRSLDSLSGGEQQRVQLARVLSQLWSPANGYRDKVLLLDEPLNNLDINFQHLVLDEARRVVQENGTVIAVVHDLNLARRYADACLLLHQGRAVAAGSPANILTPEWLEPVFEVRCQCLPRTDGTHFLEFQALREPATH